MVICRQLCFSFQTRIFLEKIDLNAHKKHLTGDESLIPLGYGSHPPTKWHQFVWNKSFHFEQETGKES